MLALALGTVTQWGVPWIVHAFLAWECYAHARLFIRVLANVSTGMREQFHTPHSVPVTLANARAKRLKYSRNTIYDVHAVEYVI